MSAVESDLLKQGLIYRKMLFSTIQFTGSPFSDVTHTVNV
jgi:hypothetical protein